MENIELRSERVNNLIGEIPPLLIRSGTGIIFFILAGVITAACLIPYPETVTVQTEIKKESENSYCWVCFIPYKQVNRIDKGMKATIEMEGFNANEYGYLQGRVSRTDKRVFRCGEQNFFRVILKVDWSQASYKLQNGMRGTATFLLTNRSFMQHLLPRI